MSKLRKGDAKVVPCQTTALPLNDLQTSTGALKEQIGVRKERDRILQLIKDEEKAMGMGWISYDRLKRIIEEGR